MKKIALIFAGAALIASCGEPASKDKELNNDNDATIQADPAGEEALDPAIIENPASADNPDASGADLPVLSFEKEKYEFPEPIVQGASASYSFKFTNTGKSDLIISDATAPCGCTIPSYSKEPIPPGGKGKIDVTFNSEGKDAAMHEKAIRVFSNSIPNPRILTIVVHVDKKTQ